MEQAPMFRPDLEQLRAANGETRSPDRLLAHYIVERDLAERLRQSQPQERSRLYGEVYGELFARLPDHPQHKMDPARRRLNTATQVAFLRSIVRPHDVFLELGCGDAAVTCGVAAFVAEAIGVDVTAALIDAKQAPANFRFLHTNGTELDLPADAADIVYSNQLMEHLHPMDAMQQLREIHRVLKPGGRYICTTPNRITGPHDISVYFGDVPNGFHLREYDHASLSALFREAGFRTASAHITLKGWRMVLPVRPVIWVERLVSRLPRGAKQRLTQIGPVRNLAGVTLIGIK